MFWIFDVLGKRGASPFDSGRVEYWKAEPQFDWSKLPKNLRYLAEVAEKFGRFHGDDSIEELDDEQMSELAAFSERIRLRGDAPAIEAWLKEYDWTVHPEANYLAWTLWLLVEADLPIED